MEHNEHLDGDPKKVKESIGNCWACNNCYDFCGSLQVKKAKKGSELVGDGERDLEVSWQPKWGVVYIDPSSKLNPSGYYLEEGEITLASGFILRQWSPNIETVLDYFKEMDAPYLLFLVNKAHWSKIGTGQKGDGPYDVEEFANDQATKYPLPDIYNQQPHLLNHSSLQPFFQKKLLTTANLRHLDIQKINGRFHLIFALRIRSSIAGILYYFESKEIFFKWELKVQGTMSNNKMGRAVAGFFKKLWGAGKGLAIGAISGGAAGSAVPVAGTAAGAVAGGGTGAVKGWSDADKEEKKKAGAMPPSPDAFFKQFGLGLINGNDNKETEKQTERRYKSTIKALEKTVEPAIFFSNTVDFNYDFWEFANRCIKNPFEIRFEHSDMLYNNLVNSNDKSPLQNMSCRYSAFKQLIKVGFFCAEVSPWWDYQGIWRNICSSGVFFYDDLDELFKPWKPIFKLTQSSDFRAIADIGNIVGEEEIYEIDDEEMAEVDRPKGNNYHQRGHYFIFYEDGSQEHWMALYPPFNNNELADGHTHGAFTLEFPKPVKKFVDIYSCIGCGAQDTPLFETLHPDYRKNPGGSNPSDSWDTIHKGLPFEPWFTEMGKAVSPQYDLTVNGVAGRLGSKGDVWEKATQEKSDGGSFKKAYGFVPSGDTIRWRLGGKSFGIRYKGEKQEIEKEEFYESKEFVEPEWTDDKTQFNSLIGETDPEGFEGEPPEQEREHQQEWDKPEKD
ncbi:MAG: hypothetical protein MRECE_40c002 [Mycoplasmataceae bacterium CE_OT135]|nr:MAG: hypothetical protein MRECE_40c002 [Mycoplasmataceae bacterium CE_OT135]